MLYVIDNNKMGFEANYWFVETDVSQEIVNKILNMPKKGSHSIVFTTEKAKWFEGDPISLDEYVQDFEFNGNELELSEFQEIKLSTRKELLQNAIEETRQESVELSETIMEYSLEEQEKIEQTIEEMSELIELCEAKLKSM